MMRPICVTDLSAESRASTSSYFPQFSDVCVTVQRSTFTSHLPSIRVPETWRTLCGINARRARPPVVVEATYLAFLCLIICHLIDLMHLLSLRLLHNGQFHVTYSPQPLLYHQGRMINRILFILSIEIQIFKICSVWVCRSSLSLPNLVEIIFPQTD